MNKIKVLMVDDEAQFRKTTAKILTRRGFETTVAGAGEEAIEILRKAQHDVVVLDIKMPGMDGHEALSLIKELAPQTQVIMLTGHAGLESARESLKHGAFDYLSKPCDIDRLVARIHDAHALGHKDRHEEKNAGELMIPIEDYTTIGPAQSVREGIDALRRSFEGIVSTGKLMQTGHRSILVMDDRQQLIGVLGIIDLIEALRPSYLSAPKPSTADSMSFSPMFWSGLFKRQALVLAKKKVGDIMSPPPPRIAEDANLMEVSETLHDKGCRRLAVMRGEQVVGVVREQEIFFELSHMILMD